MKQSSLKPVFLETQPSSTIPFDFLPNEHVKSNIILINVHNQPVLFKIRTTAPSCYAVNPNLGILNPSEVLEISLEMQPKELSHEILSIKDKFQINATPFLEENYQELDHEKFQEIWGSVPKDLQQKTTIPVEIKLSEDQILDAKSVSNQNLSNLSVSSRENSLEMATKCSSGLVSPNRNGESHENLVSGNSSSMSTPQAMDKSLKKGSMDLIEEFDENACVRQRINLLEKKLDKITSEVQLLKMQNQELFIANSKREKLVEEIIEDNQIVIYKIREAKMDPFQHGSSKIKSRNRMLRNYQISHLLFVAIFGLIIGRLLL